jgi:transcriptional regulator with XRE-family HTH domain
MDRIGKKHPSRLYIREWMARETPTLTQELLAGRMDTQPGTVSKLLNGKMEMTTGWLANFADALDLSVPDLFRDPSAPTPAELLAAGTPEELRQAIRLVQSIRGKSTGTDG